MQPNQRRPERASPEDLDAVYRREGPKLTRYFRSRVRENDEAADLVQEAFARLAGFMARSPLSQPAPYLQRIARNLLFDRSKSQERRLAPFRVQFGEGVDPGVAPEQTLQIEAGDVMRVYRRALGELPDKTRDVFLLHRVEELTYKDIAHRLGLSIPTVQYHVARALSHIDAALERE
ncbi:RNA polymerase subunit sigma-24 (plasmid) [Sphingomonas panacis]|uniref:RNA polymerase subunit sigma-24 n=1 Tax=Sphingomonas panacis TaxID=1560345 RepID=A0A1B3ZIS2_9SPHN|nr:RNA polymerase subunit sigma-24 [Sphingomonas panacis]